MAVKPIPDGYHSVTPFVSLQGAARLIDFAKQAFGAQELMRIRGPGDAIMHAEIRIGDSILMMSDAIREGPMPGAFYLYVTDPDAVYKRALEAGASSRMEPADMFWGDRMGQVKDPFGNIWSIATHKQDVPREELAKRAAAAMKQQR